MTILERILTPHQRFVKVESLSGILLFGVTLVALVWANSAYGGIYKDIWQYEIGIQTGSFELVKPLILWINDGLMAIFFFLIGLEIKRELSIGELNTLRKAALPIFGAVGGIVLPIAFFFLVNRQPETMHAWGIPMATDIAFTLAILKLLGDRVPVGLKVFLTAFAIIDDLAAVLAIAIFYSGSMQWDLLLYSGVLLAILFTLSKFRIYSRAAIFGFGAVIWYFFLKAGIHPTIAGVLVAFTVPIRQRIDIGTFTDRLKAVVRRIKGANDPEPPILSEEQINHLDKLQRLTSRVHSPLQLLEHRLHKWVAFFIIPVFALANAGIVFSGEMPVDISLVLAIAVGLVLGKSIGVSLFAWIAVRMGLADLPKGVGFRQILGVGILAGVGFTMSVFIANLAFTDNAVFLNSAKIGVLAGSFIAGLAGYLLLYFTCNAKSASHSAPTGQASDTDRTTFTIDREKEVLSAS